MVRSGRTIIIMAVFIICCVFGQTLQADTGEGGSGKSLMAILPLHGEVTYGHGDMSDSVYQRVMTALFKTKRFDFVERAQLASVLGEARLQHSGLFDDKSAVRLGKQLGVSTVVVGSFKALYGTQYYGNGVTVYPASMELNIRFVNVKTGKVENLVKTTASGTAENILDRFSEKLEREISNLYSSRGYVIKALSDGEVVIDLGTKDGVAEGDEFNVIEYGEDIRHPVTKKIIKGEKKLINQIEVASVSEETSTAKITGTQAPIRVGSLIESKPKKAGFWESVNDIIKR